MSIATGGFGGPPVVGIRKNCVKPAVSTSKSPSDSQIMSRHAGSHSAIGSGGELPSTDSLTSRESADCALTALQTTTARPSGDGAYANAPSDPAIGVSSNDPSRRTNRRPDGS